MRAGICFGFAMLWAAQAYGFKADFSPKGEQATIRQIRVVFSEAMVPFGDPRGKEPFRVKCATKGKGQWEDTRTWIYEIQGGMGGGERCSFEGNAEFKSEKGGSWEGEKSFTAATTAPTVVKIDPRNGNGSIEEDQAFVLTLTGAVDPASLAKAAYFQVEGIPERIPTKLVPPAMREKVLAASKRYSYYDEDGESGEKQTKLVLQPARNFPALRKVRFVWDQGIRSVSGVVSSHPQMFDFATREPFKATMNCMRENADGACLPIGSISLNFNETIRRADAEKIRLTIDGKKISPELESKQEEIRSVTFNQPFPPSRDFSIELPAKLKDSTGRALSNAKKFPLRSKIGAFPPLAKFAAPFGVIEAKEAVLPVTLRKVEAKLGGTHIVGSSLKLDDRDPAALLDMINAVKKRHDSYMEYIEQDTNIDHREESLLAGKGGQKWELPKPAGMEPSEVVGIPLKEKGLHVVELESKLLGKSLLGKPKPMFVASAALVTDLAVHFKWGQANSLVFVTALSSAKPVGGAAVRIFDCHGKEIWKGKTEGDGVARVEGIPAVGQAPVCEKRGNDLIVLAKKDDDFSLTSSGWDSGIEPWRFQVDFSPNAEENFAHTVFDRTLLRAGQTVHMKHFLRLAFLRGLKLSKNYPKTVVLEHASGQRIVFPLKFDANGTAETEWKIPEAAKLGTYEVYLSGKEVKENKPAASHAANLSSDSEAAPSEIGDDESGYSYGKGNYRVGDFRVEEFRLPVMTASLQFGKEEAIAPKEVNADISVRFLNGGGASQLPVSFRAKITDSFGISLPSFEGFSFANGGVVIGREPSTRTDPELNLKVPPVKLDDGGNARVRVPGIPEREGPTNLQLEAEYRDPNGAIQTVSRSVKIYPSAALVGLRTDGWLAKQDNVKFQVAAATPEGKPLAGQNVRVVWVENKYYSHRKRLVGGFYAYENYSENSAMGEACQGKTDAHGILNCEGKAPGSGSFILVAETLGPKKSVAKASISVAGNQDDWFPAENHDRADLLPEKKSYEAGEKARLQVRTPYREATALITVEREGLLEHFVRTVEAKDPVIEVPMKPEYAPNVYISALLVRGRVGEPAATALVDLAKPSYKLGLAEVKVGRRPHELKVSVESDRDEYKVREKARVKVKASRADGTRFGKGEVLLVAVDEALLELRGNDSWDLLSGMMGHRPLRVATSTVQGQVIGKRHFGLKALPAGGGGGVSSARELFDTLLYWKAVLPLDGNGEATAEVPLNDSLSSFRIVAIATEGADRFGTGQKAIRTRQDLMLFAGVSPFARQGDQTHPELTVRNSGKDAATVEVRGMVNGSPLKNQKVEVAAGTSQSLHWDFTVPEKVAALTYEFSASAGSARDQVKFVQKVEAPYVPAVLQGTLERLEKPLSFSANPPSDAYPGTAGLEVRVESKLASNLGAVKAYMQAYPYQCLEQRTSKIVTAQDEKAWKELARSLPQYMDAQGLLKYFPELSEGSEVLTAYVLSVADASGLAISESILPRIMKGMKDFVEGRTQANGFVYPAADLTLRKLAVMEAMSRYHSFDPKWLAALQLDPAYLPLSALVDYRNILSREEAIPNGKELLKKVDLAVHARIAFRGTVIGFQREESENLWWLMGSADSSAVKLLDSVVLDPSWAGDIGRLVRGVLARQKQGHWDLTTANAWGSVAMKRFSEKFESEAVSGVTEVSANGKRVDLEPGKEKKSEAFFPLNAPTKVEVKHRGQGKPWAFLFSKAALQLKSSLSKGYTMKRTVTAVQRKRPGKWSVGDVYRVSLELEGSSDMTWVALTDPIPAGASLLGSGLGGDGASFTKGEESKGAWPTYEERSFGGYRGYYQWLPKGKATIQYTVRLNSAGHFLLPNSRIEAMYAPEMFAEAGNAPMDVAE
jgi:uncharacterized protein YfaS (alpha-2-macroglobulin family)